MVSIAKQLVFSGFVAYLLLNGVLGLLSWSNHLPLPDYEHNRGIVSNTSVGYQAHLPLNSSHPKEHTPKMTEEKRHGEKSSGQVTLLTPIVNFIESLGNDLSDFIKNIR